MMEESKIQDMLKSTFKETPESFRNTVNNAIIEVVQDDSDKQKPQEKSEDNIINRIEAIIQQTKEKI